MSTGCCRYPTTRYDCCVRLTPSTMCHDGTSIPCYHRSPGSSVSKLAWPSPKAHSRTGRNGPRRRCAETDPRQPWRSCRHRSRARWPGELIDDLSLFYEGFSSPHECLGDVTTGSRPLVDRLHMAPIMVLIQGRALRSAPAQTRRRVSTRISPFPGEPAWGSMGEEK